MQHDEMQYVADWQRIAEKDLKRVKIFFLSRILSLQGFAFNKQ